MSTEPALLQWTGDPPTTMSGVPHIQLDQNSDDELMRRFTTWAFSIDVVVEQPSRASLPGARALTVAPSSPIRPEAMMVGREFAHIHPPPTGGTMHMLVAERPGRRGHRQAGHALLKVR